MGLWLTVWDELIAEVCTEEEEESTSEISNSNSDSH